LAFLKSGQDVYQAAAYKIGGKKIKKTISGCNAIGGSPGTKPISIPARTNRIGYGTRILSVTSARAVTTARRTMTRAMLLMEC
jgi:hypothetical protein